MNTTTTTENKPKLANIYDWFKDQIEARGLANVPSVPLKRDEPKAIQKRKTRYGVLPVWSVPCQAQDYNVWTLPGNQIFPFRYFHSQSLTDAKGEVLEDVFRDTPSQIEDVRKTIKDFVELPELLELDDEAAADRIAQVIHLPRKCSKYPTEIGFDCTTCWLTYLEKDLPEKIDNELEGEEKSAAYSVARKIITGLEAGLAKCREFVSEALYQIDDPKMPKGRFSEFDLNCVYHLHQDRPQFRSSVNQENNLADTVTSAFDRLSQVLSAKTLGDPSQDAGALRNQIAMMQKQLEEAEKSEASRNRFIELFDKDLPGEIDTKRQKNLDSLEKARNAKKDKEKNNTESVEA